MRTTELLTPTEMAYALEITEYTLQALVHNGAIPHTYVQSPASQDRLLRFDPYTVTEWMQSSPKLEGSAGKDYIDGLKNQYKTRFPHVLTALKTLDKQFSPPRKGKGYTLSKITSKKYGFLYYVRYIEHGKLVRSRWNTRTNNLEAAECFARDNRERILVAYHGKHDTDDKMYTVLESYYEKGSPYIDAIKSRGRRLCERVRGQYHSFVKNEFAPFLKTCQVKCFNEITAPVISKFQNKLLAGELKPQTINRYMIGVRTIFDHMVRDGYMAENILNRVDSLKTRPGDCKVVGCYEAGKPDNIFNKPWKDELAYLLNLLIYSTGIRNSEIMLVRPRDIIIINTCRFIDIKESKTETGIRLVPLHDFVYERLAAWIKKNGVKDDDFLFAPAKLYDFTKACLILGKKLGLDKAALQAQNIGFYSGRHYWKTLMNAHGLGDIEEYFMGHKVSKDVSERYNHRDKQGQKHLLAKAREVSKILDKTLFKNRLTKRAKQPIVK
ncbi:MAG: tyrosine-type recombinase/integrase [Spirochaetaceae bacterium]|jgi:integrase|nr:tyrosine-type recombinase/integrase [Spirochaetaceae bacterium]